MVLLIAVPWHVLAAIRNPPVFDFTMHSAPGEYHGFLWFFFINEQLLRFLNLRYPRDYNTVPRAVLFWSLHLLWLFPWSVYLPAVTKLDYRPVKRAGQVRLLALCWIGFVLVFFTFSTTQEYYSMPCYPAFALLLGSAMAEGGVWIRRGNRVLCVIAVCAAVACLSLAAAVWNYPTPGDIATALESRPGTYTLSLDHMKDLTLPSFAYLRTPLLVAGIAFLAGAIGLFRAAASRAFLAAALMMVLFFHAARLALVVFDPYLSSRPLADALLKAPQGDLVVDHHYYTYSSVFFYTDRTAQLLNGRINNLVYGSYAPGAPDVFMNDHEFHDRWLKPQRCYLVASDAAVTKLAQLVGAENLRTVVASGGKQLVTNQPCRVDWSRARLSSRYNAVYMRRPMFVAFSVALILSFTALGSSLPVNQIVAFGDSLTDTGNASIATLGAQPGPGYAYRSITGIPFQVGEFTNPPAPGGPSGLWIDQFAAAAGLPDPQPFLAPGGGTNYAVGSGETGSASPQDVGNQLAAYLAGKTSVPPTSLYSFWAGANDILAGANPITAADNLEGDIATLASGGGKYFVWFNLPLLGDTPAGVASGNAAALNLASEAFDAEWAKDIASFDQSHPNTVLVGVDVGTLFAQILAAPGHDGFNVTGVPISIPGANPNGYLFWDGLHPTSAGDTLIANLALADFQAAVPEPASAALVLLGLVGVLAKRRRK